MPTFTPPIYNYVSTTSNPLTWREFLKYNIDHGNSMPSTQAVSVLFFYKLDLIKQNLEYV